MGGSAAVAAVCDGARGCCWCCRHFYVVAWRAFAADVAVAVEVAMDVAVAVAVVVATASATASATAAAHGNLARTF